MNIFNVLSQGKGNLNEENLSAMLAYLLSPNGSHGLGDTLLKRFLKLIEKENTNTKNTIGYILSGANQINADVILESPYRIKGKKRYPDIELRIYNHYSNNYDSTEYCRVIIENKIKATSADLEQFKEEYQAVKKDIRDNESSDINVIMVFVTPKGEHQKLEEEYSMLTDEVLNEDNKVWFLWDSEKENDIAYLIKGILKSEDNYEIDPISDYIRHTLKAFIRHIIKSNIPEGIEEVAFVEISTGQYRIEKYKSSTIKIYNLEEEEYEVAKPLLRKINKEKDLKVDLFTSTGTKLNTRSLGRKIIEQLKLQGEEDR